MPRDLLSHFSAIRAEWLTEPKTKHKRPKAVPFVTIARQAGAGGRSLAERLGQSLNELDPSPEKWRIFDRDLVEKIAADHDLSTRVVERLDQTSHSQVRELLEGLILPDEPTPLKVFHRCASTIRGLAESGRSIIVGLGGVYITRDLPAGLHVYLVAPQDYRIRRLAEEWGLSEAEAKKQVSEIEANRKSFYKKFFPRKTISSETFDVTINVAHLAEDRLADALVPLLRLAGETDA